MQPPPPFYHPQSGSLPEQPAPNVAFIPAAPYPTPQPVYYTSDPSAYQQQVHPVPPAPRQPHRQLQPRAHYSSTPAVSGFSRFAVHTTGFSSPAPSPVLAEQSSRQPAPRASTSATASLPPRPTSTRPVPPSSTRREDSPLSSDQLADLERYRRQPLSMATDYAAQYAEACREIAGFTVDRLKYTIKRFNASLGTYLKLSGLKNELYNRVKDHITALYYQAEKSKFVAARRIVSEARTASAHTMNSPGAAPSYSTTGANAGAYTSPTSAYYNANAYASTSAAGGYGAARAPAYGAGAGASTSGGSGLPAPRFGGYNAATGATGGGGGAGGAGGSGGAGGAGASWQNQRIEEIPIKFRPSPFFRVDKSLCSVVTLPKAAQGDRKQMACMFALTEAQRTLLDKAKQSPANAQYQVRLYCTSDTNWNVARPASNQFPAPIEFPPSAELRLNGVQVQANIKGIKKQPGTAPPVNLSEKKKMPAVNTAPGALNKVELVYTNTEKVYYMAAYLIEYTPIDKVVSRVKAGKTRSKEEVIQNIIDMNSDEDIEATSFAVSLRDPLSFIRIEIPIRSVHCNHIACFDANIWFEMNEQTPTWQCPICSKTLKVDDMIVDAYFEDLLKTCSDDVESVTVEPDGTWRSDDDKHGTAKPRTAPPSAAASGRNTPLAGTGAAGAEGVDEKGKGRATPPDDGGAPAPSGNGAGAAVLLLDSDTEDDDDQPLAKRPRLNSGFTGAVTPAGSTSSAGGGAARGTVVGGGGGAAGGKGDVLDLTLSSDDEDDAQPRAPPPRPGLSSVMGRVSSTGSEKKTAVEVQRDIDAMHVRLRDEYGENWRDQFGY
ncbi:hypothetical protein JCM10207_003219 [Rhodosporidiobolus poonsookiae]